MNDLALKRHQRACLTPRGEPAASVAESILVQHPPSLPNPLPQPNRYLCILPTSSWSSTAEWSACHARWQARAEAVDEATDPVPAAMAQAARAVLDWRAALPEQLQFWREDTPASRNADQGC